MKCNLLLTHLLSHRSIPTKKKTQRLRIGEWEIEQEEKNEVVMKVGDQRSKIDSENLLINLLFFLNVEYFSPLFILVFYFSWTLVILLSNVTYQCQSTMCFSCLQIWSIINGN
jgi:hypothetical protein